MKKLLGVICSLISILIIFAIFSKGVCIFFNCQLSITDFGLETLLAMGMATFLVIVIDIHLTRYKFWRFCKISLMQLKSVSKKNIESSPISRKCPSKKELLEVIEFMQVHENLMFGALTFEQTVAIRARLKLYRNGLTSANQDLSLQIFQTLEDYLKKLLIRFKPPRYIMLATKYFGGL